MKSGAYKEQAKLYGVLSHPARLRILEVLAQGEACVCHLCAVLRQRQAYVSQQLAALKQAGLITDTREGLYVYYSLADDGIARVLDEGRHYVAHAGGHEAVAEEETIEADHVHCVCPRCQARRLES